MTHDGVFHSDDVFAAATLRLSDPDISIVRTRNPEMIGAANIAFDVGECYDLERGRYDHHQKGGAGQRENGIPYASFGLIWQEYGVSVCGDGAVAAEIDRTLVQFIDAGDNGIDLAKPTRDDVRVYNVAHAISSFNPGWDEDVNVDEQFALAVEFATQILQRCIVRARGTLAAHDIVTQAITDADDPRIVVLPRFCPWQEALIPASAEALFVIYESFGSWRVQAVPEAIGTFASRQLLPEAWGGLDGEALQAVTGVADATFCHKGRFIAGATNQEAVLTLARLAV
jgi:uncharacterized UPF0160 family protein